MQKLLGDWIALQVLVVNATISGTVGLIVLFGFARASDEKSLCKGGIVAVSWLISGVLFSVCLNNSALKGHTLTLPPIHLLHSINQYCVTKKRNLFPMKERDLKFNKTEIFLVSIKS